MTVCCSKKNVITGLATAVWAWVFDFLWHGQFLMPKYEATKEVWRPMDQMQTMGAWCVGYHLVMGFLVASAYNCWRSKVTVGEVGSSECPFRKSMCWGVTIGLLIGVPMAMSYVWLPLASPELPILWMVGEVIKWTLAGCLLNKLYGKI